ncbi:uroporphyrinogen-III C-methyltransferase [Croceicoccus ponticola]|uniref:uroporphyrinogen-III C-methyltransferase n=1 Tax=Croceicoccus ponticola TaxID=2217664 RepID=A0A437GVE7_9SPHN|nr:uroporphyrinogen-III C-methyltransferase [Croceicoccus ponticola]RVQ65760.1 uroporphyrinogen-III C-methyltransferase [Croceicoccus ponticola]
MTDFRGGEVWLVGAGPGDPDLLTRKAERLMTEASVIFYDALVGEGVLALVPPHVRMVPVGKRSGRHSKDQTSIDRLIVEAALAGEKVVRLKGGDPAIFARSNEELEACRAEGISVRICPGITAASAAAADLGMSLTLRGLARRLTFVTAHALAGERVSLDWHALADPQATLAVYMGKAAARDVSAGLIAAGLPRDTPCALVEQASLPTGGEFLTRLDLLPIAARTALGDGPALILIGQAVGAAVLPQRANAYTGTVRASV